jgi:hypothetical protein
MADEDDRSKRVELGYRGPGDGRYEPHPEVSRRWHAKAQAWVLGCLTALAWALVVATCGGLLRGGGDPYGGAAVMSLFLIVVAVILTVLTALRWASIAPPE